MSHRERYGTIVYEAWKAASIACRDKGDVYVTVGEVSRHAKVAPATARKYLKQLEEMGLVTSMRAGGVVWYASYQGE